MIAKTTDLGLAAALLCIGKLLERIDDSEAQRVFCFWMDPVELDVAYGRYKDHAFTVDAYKHAQMLKDLKRRLRSPRA